MIGMESNFSPSAALNPKLDPQKITSQVPLICFGYLPPLIRRVLELRAARLTNKQIAAILKEEARR